MAVFLLSVSPLTSASFTYTLPAGLSFPPPCPTAQLTISYQTADEESETQLVSAISYFCTAVDLVPTSMGSYVRMRAW